MKTFRSTAEVVDELQSEGFDVRRSYVQFLVRDNWVPSPQKIGNACLWDEIHINALKRELRRRNRWDPESALVRE